MARCAQCGAEIPDGQALCAECEAESVLGAAPVPVAPVPATQRGQRPEVVWIAMVILACNGVLMAVLGLSSLHEPPGEGIPWLAHGAGAVGFGAACLALTVALFLRIELALPAALCLSAWVAAEPAAWFVVHWVSPAVRIPALVVLCPCGGEMSFAVCLLCLVQRPALEWFGYWRLRALIWAGAVVAGVASVALGVANVAVPGG